MSAERPKRLRRISAGVLTVSVLIMIGEWILLVAGFQRDEMIAGALCIVASALFLQLVYRAEQEQIAVRLKDLLAGWRIPWYIVTGSWEIVAVLFKDLLHIQRAGSFYRVGGFETGKYDPLMISRRVLATAYTTTAPNFIVLGIDYHQSRMLFHQLERSPVPRMTQELGAKR